MNNKSYPVYFRDNASYDEIHSGLKMPRNIEDMVLDGGTIIEVMLGTHKKINEGSVKGLYIKVIRDHKGKYTESCFVFANENDIRGVMSDLNAKNPEELVGKRVVVYIPDTAAFISPVALSKFREYTYRLPTDFGYP